MTWIKTRSPSDPQVAAALASTVEYPEEYKTPVHAVTPDGSQGAQIVMAHSLLPNVMLHSFSAFGAMMDPELPLSRRDHEMIAATVSSVNDCFY